MIDLGARVMFKKDTEFIGLDIGTTGIRLVQVKNEKEGFRLSTYGHISMDAKVLQSDSVVDRGQLTAGIKKLLEQSRASAKNVIAGLPSSKVFTSLISLPKMTPAELEQSVQYQAEQHIPMAIDQVKLDWMVVGQSADSKNQEILLVAAPKTLSERYLAILDAAGLEAEALEPDALALARALVNEQEQAAVVIDIGANSTDLVTVHSGKPKLVRAIPTGGDTFVKAAAQALNLESDQAYQFVYKFGLAQTKMEGQVKKAIQPTVDSLVAEMDKSNRFFLTRYKEAKISKIILTGRASMIPELPAYIANGVNLPVEIGNSWSKILTPADLAPKLMEVSNEYAVACGLALRGN